MGWGLRRRFRYGRGRGGAMDPEAERRELAAEADDLRAELDRITRRLDELDRTPGTTSG